MTKYDIQVSEDKSSLAFSASDLIARIIESTLKDKSRVKGSKRNYPKTRKKRV